MPQFKFSRDHIDAGILYESGDEKEFDAGTCEALKAAGAGDFETDDVKSEDKTTNTKWPGRKPRA